jgi:predicted acylesterase/phospholipase RssA
VLEEAGLKPQLVVGTSAGSLVAALYASGKTSAQLQQTALNMEEVAITDWMLPIFGRGMFRGDALARYVNDLVANRLMENMAMPLGIVATDLNSGQAVLFQRGDTGTAVRASSAVPAVFLPVKIGGREYVDGGLVSPVPVRFARQMGAEVVVAVDISSPPEGNPPATRCRSCCRPLPSWARASTSTSSRTPTSSCGLRSRPEKRRLLGAAARHRCGPRGDAGGAAATEGQAAARAARRRGALFCSGRAALRCRRQKKAPVLRPGL